MASGKQYELLFRLTAQLGPNFPQSFKTASHTMKLLQGDLKSTGQKIRDVSAYKKQQKAVEDSRQKAAALQQEYDKLAGEIGDVDNASGKQKKALDKSAQALAKARDAAAGETARLEEMGSALRQTGVNTGSLSRDTQDLRQQYERLERAQQKVLQISQQQGANSAKIAQSKAQLAGLAGTAAAAGAAIYNGPVKKAADFQEQMSAVQAISGASGGDLKKLSEKARQMGATTKFTATEAGEAMEYMAMAGWKTKDMLGGIEGIMNLAAASGEELGSVSDIVTDAMTAFGMAADGTTKVIGKNGLTKEVANATHFADILAAASSNANTNVGMMGETFKYVAPVAGSLGYTAEDTANLIGLMANSGIKASQAGTSLRKIFLGMQGGVKLTGDRLGKYHLEVENTDGSMRKLSDVTKDLRKAFGQMTEAEQAANAEKIAGKTGMSGLLAIVNASEKDYKKLTKAITGCDGAAEEMAKVKLDNFSGQVTLFQSAFDGLQIEMGLMLLPALTQAVKKITEVTSAAADFAAKNPETVKMIAKIAAGLAGLKAGGLVAKIGFLHIQNGFLGIRKAFTLLQGIGLPGLINTLTNGFGGLAGAGKGVLSYFKGIGGAAGGIASAFGNILAGSSMFSKLGGVMKNAGLKMMGLMLKPFSMFGARLSGVLADAAGVIARSPLGTIGAVIGKGLGRITAFIAPVGNAIKSMLGPLGKLAGSIFGPLGGVAGKVLPVVGVITAVITAVQLVKSHLQEIRGFIQQTFGDGALAVFDRVVQTIANIGDTIRNVFSDGSLGAARNKIQEIFGDRGAGVFDALIKALETVQGAAANILQFITGNVVPVARQVLDLLAADVIPGILTVIQGAAPVIMQIIQEIAGFLAQVIPAIGNFVAGLMPVIGQVISFIQENVFPVVSSIFSFIVSTVLPAILAGVQQLSSVITTVLTAVLPVVQTVFMTIFNIIQPIMQVVLQVVQAVLPSVFSIFQSVFAAIGGVVSAFQQVLSGIIQFISGVFSGNWSAAWNGVKAIFSGVWEAIKSIATGAIETISGAVNGIINGISKVKETVGGIGGKIAKTLHIPGFAGGMSSTPDTFIAGEDGPELITNAPGMKVYTAAQTRLMLDRAAQAGRAADPAMQVHEIRASGGSGRSAGGAGAITVNVTSSPNITITGRGDAAGIEEQLKQYDAELMDKIQAAVLAALKEEKEQEDRAAYA